MSGSQRRRPTRPERRSSPGRGYRGGCHDRAPGLWPSHTGRSTLKTFVEALTSADAPARFGDAPTWLTSCPIATRRSGSSAPDHGPGSVAIDFSMVGRARRRCCDGGHSALRPTQQDREGSHDDHLESVHVQHLSVVTDSQMHRGQRGAIQIVQVGLRQLT